MSCSRDRMADRWTHALTTKSSRKLLKEARIDDRRLYDGSRHTAGTILNELGVDMPTIMEILRHTQISQTRRYVKGRSHLSKDAMRRMGEFFGPRPHPRNLARLRPEVRPPTPVRSAPGAAGRIR
jgi:integrase